MSDEDRLDRRGFVRRAGAAAAGAFGFAGAGSARGAAEDGVARQTESGENVTRFRMVLPALDVLRTTYANVAILPGLPIRPGERPPPECFPEGEPQWRAYDAVAVDLTESSLLGGDGNAVGEIVRTRTYSARPLQPGTPYRVVGVTPCEEYLTATVHELADELDVSIDVGGGDGQ